MKTISKKSKVLIIIGAVFLVIAIFIIIYSNRTVKKKDEHTVLFTNNEKTDKHSILLDVKNMNWSSINWDDKVWQYTRWIVYYDGNIECYEKYTTNNEKMIFSGKLSDETYSKVNSFINDKLILYTECHDCCDGDGWSMTYYNLDGKEEHSFNGYIYDNEDLKEISTIFEKAKSEITQ